MTTETLQFMVLANTAQLDKMQAKIATMNASLAKGTVGATGKASGGMGRMQKASQAMGPIGQKAGLIGAGFLLASGLAVKAAANFEQSMNILQAQTNALPAELEKARQAAIDLGNDAKLPGVSAKDAADTMVELAKGGFNVKQSQDAARGSLLLAKAANMDYAASATIVARTLKAFNMPAKEAGTVVDALAAGELKSTATMQELADGMAYVSNSAKSLGINVVDTTAGLAMLNDAGVSGSKAGTSLNQMFERMTPASAKAKEQMKDLGLYTKKGGSAFFDAKGEFIGMSKASDVLSKSLKNSTTEEKQAALKTIFGTQGKRAANVVLAQGTKKYKEYQKAIGTTGAADKLAAARSKGAKGAIEQLKNAVDTLAITFGSALLPAVQAILGPITTVFTWLSKHPKVVVALVAVVVTLAATLWILSVALSVAATAAVVLEAGLMPIVLIAVAVVAAIALIGIGLYLLWTRSETFRNIVIGAWEAIKKAAQIAFEFVLDVIEQVVDYLKGKFIPVFEEVRDFIVAWTPVWQAAWKLIQVAVKFAVEYVKGYLQVLKAVVSIAFGYVKFIVLTWIAVWKLIISVVAGVIRLVAALLQGDWQGAWDAAKDIVGAFVTFFKTILTNAKNLIGTILAGIGNIVKGFLRGPLSIVKALLGQMKRAFSSAWNAVKGFVSSGVSAVGKQLDRLEAWIGGLPGRAAAKIADLGQKLYTGAMNAVQRLGELERAFFNAAVTLGRQIIEGVLSGLANLASAVMDRVRGAVTGAIGWVGDHAGSTLAQFAAYTLGVPIVVGTVAGVDKAAPQLQRSLQAMITRSIRSLNVQEFSDLVQHAFQGVQSAQLTPAEAKLAGMERQEQVDQLTKALNDATVAGDATAVAAAQRDIEMFNLREQAERERRILDERQFRASRDLSAALDRLSAAYEKEKGPEGKEKKGKLTAAEKKRLRRQANAVRNRYGGLGGAVGTVPAPVSGVATGTPAAPAPGAPAVNVGTIVVHTEVDVDRLTAALSNSVAVRS